ncbi:hypothetical protein H2248_012341 [Termitomyces sp. 'cryptogamus']|nr:hypothetical protein H2248_012341 [Termitomyces sp. 'cryptogamus']
MDLAHGYLISIGGAPHLADIDVEPDLRTSSVFVKRVLNLARKDRLSQRKSGVIDNDDGPLMIITVVLRILLEDVQRYAESWGKEGTINAFQKYLPASSTLNNMPRTH